MNNPLLRKIATAVLAILVLIFIGYHIFAAKDGSLTTEIASYVDEDDPGTAETIQSEGIVVRKETLVQKTADGVLAYVAQDGEKVSKNGVVAELYATTEAASAQKQLESLTEQISLLESLGTPGDTYAADQETIDKKISQQLFSLLENATTGDYLAMKAQQDDLLYMLNERQIVTGKVENFDSRIQLLTQQKDGLAANANKTGEIISPVSGQFVSTVDGYESLFDYQSIADITVSEWENKLQESVAAPAEAVGKICETFNWYFVTEVDINKASELKEGGKVTLEFPFATSKSVPGVIEAVNQDAQSQKAMLVVRCDEMNEEIARMRKETCQIQLKSYSGIRVSQKAINFETRTYKEKQMIDGEEKEVEVTKEVKGVYVMNGSEIRFCQIIPLYSNESYVICKQYPDEGEIVTEDTVSLYDEVVIGGTDLYDGKVVK
ncbi:HlyD family efflux transporter periplasmic adaptor subunit [Hydrogeniiclostridium mannosilyticum]|uniref:HlyD family efflux transporter periplasmic adaptor subunit n=1 Tax=Hydrogeniiclostridium mannosilyticum TaxID=2764322 RepID=UPI00399A8AC2